MAVGLNQCSYLLALSLLFGPHFLGQDDGSQAQASTVRLLDSREVFRPHYLWHISTSESVTLGGECKGGIPLKKISYAKIKSSNPVLFCRIITVINFLCLKLYKCKSKYLYYFIYR